MEYRKSSVSFSVPLNKRNRKRKEKYIFLYSPPAGRLFWFLCHGFQRCSWHCMHKKPWIRTEVRTKRLQDRTSILAILVVIPRKLPPFPAPHCPAFENKTCRSLPPSLPFQLPEKGAEVISFKPTLSPFITLFHSVTAKKPLLHIRR